MNNIHTYIHLRSALAYLSMIPLVGLVAACFILSKYLIGSISWLAVSSISWVIYLPLLLICVLILPIKHEDPDLDEADVLTAFNLMRLAAPIIKGLGFYRQLVVVHSDTKYVMESYLSRNKAFIIVPTKKSLLSPRCLQAALAHEIGHLISKDTRKTSLLTFLGYLATSYISVLALFLGLSGHYYLAVFASLLLFALMNMLMIWTRRITENTADIFAVKAGYGSALMELYKISKDVKNPHWRIFSIHDSKQARVKRIFTEMAKKGF